MEIFWPFILSSLAGLSTMIGCIGIFLPIKKTSEFITFALSLSLSVMLSISVFDLIPSCLPYISKSGNILLSIGIFVLIFGLGILLVMILDKYIKREQGSNNLYNLGILNFLALVLHNLPEGILTFISTYQDFRLGITLCIAIALHNIPEGISISVPIYYASGSYKKAILSTFLSGLAEPLGALFAYLIFRKFINETIISLFLIFVAGIMITLSIDKMLPEALSYNKKRPLYMGIIVGLVIVLLSLII